MSDASAATAPAPVATETKTPVAAKPRYDRSIVEGPLRPAVWKIAWPTMLTNVIGGLQGMVDHVLVGNLVGFKANAAIGVSWQIFLVVIVFISSLFTGMSVLVARFAGAGDEEKVNRTVYQAFLTAIFIALGVMAPIGYFVSPSLLNLVNAAPDVKAEALPFLRIMFVFSLGMMVFFMLGGALRSAGDARTPMMLGLDDDCAQHRFQHSADSRIWSDSSRSEQKARQWEPASLPGWWQFIALARLWGGKWVIAIPRGGGFGPDWTIIKSIFKFGLPTGVQGIAMNIGGVFMLSFIGSLAQSAAAQAAFAVSYTELFSLITWTSVGLMGAAAAVAGQNLGAKKPDRANAAVHVAARFGFAGAAFVGIFFLFFPRQLLAIFGMHDPAVVDIGVQLLRVLSVSGLLITVALTYTGGLQGTGDTRSPLYISIISQIIVPLGTCFVIKQTGTLDPIDIWLAILAGHATRCVLSVIRFRQGKWRSIKVE